MVERSTAERSRRSFIDPPVATPGAGGARRSLGHFAVRLVIAVAFAAVAFVVVAGLGSKASLPCSTHGIFSFEVAGTADRANEALRGCSTASQVTDSLVGDVAFIAGYTVLLVVGAAFFGGRGYRVSALRGASSTMAWLAVIVGGLDLVENVALWREVASVPSGPPLVIASDVWPFVAATVSWAKWALAFVVVLYVAIGVIGSLSMPWWLLEPDPDVDPDPMADGEDPAETTADDRDRNIGFCLSGGGVRSASFALGMMQRFERWHGADATDLAWGKASRVTAISGGSYMANGFAVARTARAEGSDAPDPHADAWNPATPEERHLEQHLGYLLEGANGARGDAATLIVGLLVNTLLLVALIALVSMPIGRFVASDAVEPHAASPSSGLELGVQLWGPVVVWAAIGAFITVFSVLAGRLTAAQIPIVSRFGRFVSSRVAPIGFLLLGSSVFLAVILVALPVLMVELPMLFHFLGGNESSQMVSVGGDAMPMTDVSSTGPRILQVLSSLGVVSAIVAIVQRGVSKNLVRLGGVFLALSALLLGGEWATMAAQGGDTFTWTGYVIGVTVAVVVWSVVNPEWWSLAPAYRARLRRAYATWRWSAPRPGGANGAAGTEGTEGEQLGAAFSYGNPSTDEVVAGVPDDPVNTRERPAEPSIYELAADGQPITEFCATMNVTRSGAKPRSGNRPLPEPSHQAVPQTHHGISAYSMTFASDRVSYFVPYNDGSFGEVSCRPDQLEALGFRWDGTRLTPTTCSGMSGAAVAPSMGRASVGSSGALLAFANIRLGVWQPNPRYARRLSLPEAPPTRPTKPYWFPEYPRIRLTYLIKELLGWHDPDDPYVYVTDGGHWENLGLAEMVRDVPNRPLPKELVCADASGVSIESVQSLAEAIGLAQLECATDIRIRFEPVRAKGGASIGSWNAERCVTLGVVRRGDQWSVIWYGKPVLTEDTPTDVRAYHERDSVFPATGTIDQFFDEDLFVAYRDIGRYAAAEILAARDTFRQLVLGTWRDLQDQPGWVAEELRALVTEAEWDGFTDGYLLHGGPPSEPSTEATAPPPTPVPASGG